MAKANLKKQKSKSKLQIIFDEGVKFVCKSFIAFYRTNPSNQINISSTIIASKKVGNAVKRNRAKRRLREILRLYIKPSIKTPMQLIFLGRGNLVDIEQSLLLKDCNNLIKKLTSCSALPSLLD